MSAASAAKAVAGGVAASNNNKISNKVNIRSNNNNNINYPIFKNIKKCRTCLSTNRDTVALNSVVPDAVDRATYLECLRQCIGEEVRMTNVGSSYVYPMQICLRCCRALEVATHFVRMAKDSARKLDAEATKVLETTQQQQQQRGKTLHLQEVVMKRKAGKPEVDEFSQQFTKFVQSYEPLIEENVLYMRGTKVPRVEVPKQDVGAASNDIILFDVIYDNTMDEDDENDVSDTKNNETFFEEDVEAADAKNTNTKCTNDANNNNGIDANNMQPEYQLPLQQQQNVLATDGDIIQKALFLACQDTTNVISGMNTEKSECFKEIKADLLRSLENCEPNQQNLTANTQHEEQLKPSSKLAAPIKSCITVTSIKCDLCPFSTTYPSSLRSHYQSEHKLELPKALINKPAISSVGGADGTINGVSSAASAVYQGKVMYTYKCHSCNDFTSQLKSEMCLHLTEHHKIEKSYELFYVEQQHCPSCKRVFKDQKSLRTHYTRMHIAGSNSKRESNEIYVCDNCDKSFNLKSSLHSHQRYCKAKDPVSCSFCQKQFNTVRNYELHLQQEHAVSTVHECEVCSNIFKSAEALAMHRKRHTERHFQCSECSSNYINATELKVHYERTHVHHDQVNCDTCGQQFQNRSLLREHEQRTHQEKTWRCESCDFETTTRTRLRQHQYEHTGYPYKCCVCQEEFAERSKIRQHSKKLHDIELSDEQLADMFRERLGYTSRQDAFSKANNSLEIPGFSDDCFDHLKDLGLDYDDITSDLFSNNNVLDDLLDLIP